MLVDKIKQNGTNAIYISSFDDIVKYIHENMQDNDIILTIGAGNITHLSDML